MASVEVAAEAAEGQSRDVRMPAERRLGIGPAGEQDEHARGGDPVEGLRDQLERGGIGPVHVLDDHQDRLPAGEAQHLIDQMRQCPIAKLLGRELGRRIGFQAEHRGNERKGIGRVGRSAPQQGFELGQPHRLRVGRIEAGGEGEVPHHRPEWRAGVVGRALTRQHGAPARLDLVHECPHQARLADAGLAHQQNCLALAGSRAPPPFQQERKLLIAPDHRQRRPGAPGIEPAARRSLADDLEAGDRLGDALERQGPQVAQLEALAEEPSGAVRDHDAAGCRCCLQPRRVIGRFADHQFLAGGTLADQLADHDEPGGDADPRGQRLVIGSTQLAHGPGDREPRPHRQLGIVLARVRPAEIGEDPVAHQLGDMTADPGHLADHRVLVTAQDRAHVLRVETRRECGRAHEVDEHDGKLAALRRRRRRTRRQGGDRGQEPLAVPERCHA